MRILAFITILFASLNLFAGQSGVFMVVIGKVSIERASGKVVIAKVSSVVYPGESVITEGGAKAKIVMTDRNIINVFPNTKLQIKKYTNESNDKNVDLKLDNGRIRTDVEQKYDGKSSKFEIKTGVAVVGVRGTQLVVNYDSSKNSAEIVTLVGNVAVQRVGKLSSAMGFGDNGQLSVKTGEHVVIRSDSNADKVETMKAKDFEDLKKDTTVAVEAKESVGGTN